MNWHASAANLSLTNRLWRLPELQWPQNRWEVGNVDRTNAFMPPWLQQLLIQRGLEKQLFDSFLQPRLQSLPDPGQLQDIDRAVDRILQAKAANQSVLVYGDYDVDGVCSTTILVAFLRHLDMCCDYYIPDRQSEGYGLNTEAIIAAAAQHQLLITVDCGSTAIEPIAEANRRGLDVVVVDHHQITGSLPAALAVINPQRRDCNYPFASLCAAGVTFMLVVALRRALRSSAWSHKANYQVEDLLDLVALATVADMVPLLEVNRILVSSGLHILRQGQRAGIQALAQVAGVDCRHVSAGDLAFRLAPRINARGRLQQAGLAVDMLLSTNPTQALEMARQLNEHNRCRQNLEAAVVAAAQAQVNELALSQHAAIVVEDPSWHPGVVGLVASRLVATWHRPALVIGQGRKGSGRSVVGVDLVEVLRHCAAFFSNFGGHPMAAGFTLKPESDRHGLQQMVASATAASLGEPPYYPELQLDLQLQPQHIPMAVPLLRVLAPFGQANPEPRIFMPGMKIAHKKLVGGTHMRLQFTDTPAWPAIAFQMGKLIDRLPDKVDVACCLEESYYQGQCRIQLRIIDLRPAA